MAEIGSNDLSYHTESTVLDAENPRPTQRGAYIARLTTGKTMNQKIEGIAGAIYDHQTHRRASIDEVEGRLNRRFDGIENLLRGFITEVREQFSAVNTRLDTMNVRLEAVEGRPEAIEVRLEAVDDRLEALETHSFERTATNPFATNRCFGQ